MSTKNQTVNLQIRKPMQSWQTIGSCSLGDGQVVAMRLDRLQQTLGDNVQVRAVTQSGQLVDSRS